MNTLLSRCAIRHVLAAFCLILLWSWPVAAEKDFDAELFQGHTVVMLLIDADSGEILDANRAAVNFYGYSRDQLRRMNIQQINTLSAEEVRQERKLAATERRSYFFFRHRLASAEVRTVEVHSSPAVMDGRTVLFSVIHDASRRTDVLEELARSEARLRHAEQVAGFGYWTLDVERMEYRFSHGAATLLGLDEREVWPFTVIQAMILPRYHGVMEQARRDLMERGIDYDVSFELQRLDGTVMHIRSYGQYDPESRSFFGVAHDITDYQLATRTVHRQWTLIVSATAAVAVAQLFIIALLIRLRRNRRRARLALQERESKLSALINSIQDLIFVFDNRGRIVEYHAPNSARLLIPPEAFLGKSYRDVMPSGIVAKVEQAMKKLSDDGLPAFIEYSLEAEDGTRFFSALVSPMQHPQLGRGGFMAMVRDVTDREIALQQLRRQEQQYRALVENTPDLIQRFDQQCRFLYVNSAVEYAFGRPADDYVGKTMDQMDYSVELRELLEDAIMEVFRLGTPVNVEFSRFGIAGLQYFECRITPELDMACQLLPGDQTLCFDSVLAVSRDITERKEVETDLLRAHNFYLSILDNFPTMVWRADASGHFDYFNSTWLAFVPAGTTLQNGASMERIIHPHDIEEYQRSYWQAFTVRTDFKLEYRMLHRSGEYRHILDVGRPLYDLNGNFVGYIGTCYDITERIRSHEELQEKDRMLLAQSRQAAMGEMIGNIAHQWRQPLTSLMTTIEEIQDARDFGQLSDEYFDQLAAKATEAIEYMSRTIDDFRNFFKPDREKVAFCPYEVLQRSLSMVEASFANHNIQIRMDHHEEGTACSTSGYPNEYAQVLLNILNNAKDVLLERKVAEPLIVVTVAGSNGRCVLSIEDNGGGIRAEPMEKVFEPYFTTKAPGQGTGIGLYMAKEIIEKSMDGTLRVENTACGARFTITI